MTDQSISASAALYDEAVHDNQIVALYDTEAEAQAARQVMQAAGFPPACMQVLARDSTLADFQPAAPKPAETESQGFWGALRSLFVPDEDRNTFNTVIARGHAILLVTTDRGMDRHHMISTLEATHPVDFDTRLEDWREVEAAKVMEPDNSEQLRTGQREMAPGATRVRSYISER